MTTTKPHYCMVVHAHYPIGEPRVEREAEALVKAGYEVDVFCLRHPDEVKTETISGVNIHRLPVRRHKKSGVIVQFFEYLAFFILVFFQLGRRSGWYQIVHVHNLPDFLVFAALLPRLRGTWVILDIHDLMPEFFLSRFNDEANWPVRLLKLQEQLSCRFAHYVITVSEPWRQTLIKRGTSPDKTLVVMNVAGTKFTQAAAQLKAIQKSDKDLHLIYHGTLAYRYGIDLALRAIAQVCHNLPHLHFTIHGRGEYLDELQCLANELNLKNVVTFSTEYVPIEELPVLVGSAHVGLVPYRRDVFTDGILPTKLMEYAALGLPAVVSRTSGVLAYFDDTMVKFFTPEDVDELATSIKTLYHDRSQLKQLARNLKKFDQLYNWESHKINYLNLVKSLSNN